MASAAGPEYNIRYYLAQRKLEELFRKWICLPNTNILLSGLLDKVKKGENIMEVKPKPQEQIPKFFFPEGKPLDAEILTKDKSSIDEIFGKANNELNEEKFNDVTTAILGFPKYLNEHTFKVVDKAKTGKVTKPQFTQWFQREMQRLDSQRRLFKILCKPGKDFIETDDFKPLMKSLLDYHPGLEFLKNTPEFQDRYADTVIARIFFSVDVNDDGKISFRDFKKSNLKDILTKVEEEEDINKIREYFSYEHFYVLYCRFWELDQDHDFLIDKEDFSRYEGHALSRKAVDRIFEQIPRKFKSNQKDKMSYEDFIWFMLCEEDKTTSRSLEYWFSVVDLDDNGIIGPHEMEYFYEEQVHRLEYLNHEPILFIDILCQMNDMLAPGKEGNFVISEFKKHKEISGIFFNCLLNLNKFIAYEQRDLFAIKHEIAENPDFGEWDRFAQNEYIRLAMEEENQDDSEVFDATDPWDSDHEEEKEGERERKEGGGGGAKGAAAGKFDAS